MLVTPIKVLKLTDRTGAPIESNTGWGTAPNAAEISAAASAVGAFALPDGSADSALLVTLAPGVYTAQVSGSGGGTGIGLVEVYTVAQ